MKKLFLIISFCLFTISNAQNTNAYVAPGDLRVFLDYNLGANTSLSPTQPSQGVKGNKYQWGKNSVVNSGSWTSVVAPDTALNDTIKTINDPCPSGYRLPSSTEWQGVIDNNSIVWIGDFIEDGTNSNLRATSGVLINNSLFLPATGYNYYVNGNLFSNNASGVYMSSTPTGYANYSKALDFYKSNISNNQLIHVASSLNKNTGMNVRCIKETDISFSILSNSESNIKKIKEVVYPNPVIDILKVKNLGKNEIVEIYNLSGQKLKSVKYGEGISMKNMKLGTYLIYFQNKNYIVYKK